MEVEAEVGEVAVVNGAGKVGRVAESVVDGQAVEQDFVVDESDGVARQLVGGVERRDGGLSVDAQSAGEVDGVEGACQPQVAIGVAGDVADKRLGEGVHEVEVGAAALDVEVDVFALGRHVAGDERQRLGAVIGGGLDVNLLLLLVPGYEGVERAHAALLELKVPDGEGSLNVRIVEGRGEGGPSGGQSREADGVEVDEVENVGHFHVVKVNKQLVVVAAGSYAVGSDILVAVVDAEMVYQQAVGGVENV